MSGLRLGNRDAAVPVRVLLRQQFARTGRQVVEVDETHRPVVEVMGLQCLEGDQFDFLVTWIAHDAGKQGVDFAIGAFQYLQEAVARQHQQAVDAFLGIVPGCRSHDVADFVVAGDVRRGLALVDKPAALHSGASRCCP